MVDNRFFCLKSRYYAKRSIIWSIFCLQLLKYDKRSFNSLIFTRIYTYQAFSWSVSNCLSSYKCVSSVLSWKYYTPIQGCDLRHYSLFSLMSSELTLFALFLIFETLFIIFVKFRHYLYQLDIICLIWFNIGSKWVN